MSNRSVGAHSGTGFQPVIGCALGERTPGSALQKDPFVGNLVLATVPKLTGWGMGVVSSYYRRKIYARPEGGMFFFQRSVMVTPESLRRAITSVFGESQKQSQARRLCHLICLEP